MLDAIGALRNWLAAQPAIAALVGTRIWVNRIPRADIEAADTFHPPKMLVIRQAGGAGKADMLPTDDPSITALCYGETDHEADQVRRAVWDAFRNLDRVLQDGVRLYRINQTGGPIPLVDPDIVWPAVSQNFTLKAAVL